LAYAHSLELIKVLIPAANLDKKKPFPDYLVWLYENLAARLVEVFEKPKPEKRDPPEVVKGFEALVSDFKGKKDQ
ncbi:MAG: hypothetical protein ABRQ38_29570, partial [Candidatus Eremiobacterota bacterium]